MQVLFRPIYLVAYTLEFEFRAWLHSRLDIDLEFLILSLDLAVFVKCLPLNPKLSFGSIEDPRKSLVLVKPLRTT